jgi:hypothetical protein
MNEQTECFSEIISAIQRRSLVPSKPFYINDQKYAEFFFNVFSASLFF